MKKPPVRVKVKSVTVTSHCAKPMICVLQVRSAKTFQKAVTVTFPAIKINPKNPASYNNRGFAWRNKGELDRAIVDFEQAVKLNPDYAIAFYNRGNAFYEKKDYDRAIVEYDQSIKLNPTFAGVFNSRGNFSTCNRSSSWFSVSLGKPNFLSSS